MTGKYGLREAETGRIARLAVDMIGTDQFDIEGGDPISTTHHIKTFSIGSVFDARPARVHGGDLTNIHYGIMQTIFSRYDMDKIDHQSLGIIPYKDGTPQLLGDLILTSDIGPARIVGVVDLPKDWKLTAAQTEEFAAMTDAGWQFALVLSDSHELESWLDFDEFEPNAKLNSRYMAKA